jgi:hypothetical protein
VGRGAGAVRTSNRRSAVLHALRWLLRRAPLRITEEQAIAIAVQEDDPRREFVGGEYTAREQLGCWVVEVRSRYLVGPVLTTIEIDGYNGRVLSCVHHHALGG